MCACMCVHVHMIGCVRMHVCVCEFLCELAGWSDDELVDKQEGWLVVLHAGWWAGQRERAGGMLVGPVGRHENEWTDKRAGSMQVRRQKVVMTDVGVN